MDNRPAFGADETTFYVCSVVDPKPKSDVGSMEHPIFALRAGDTSTRKYGSEGSRLTVIPSGMGRATIHDKHILIYCVSQLMACVNNGDDPSPVVRLNVYGLLKTIGRRTNGTEYRRVISALDRLAGTRIKTDFQVNGMCIRKNVGLIVGYEIIERSLEDSRMVSLSITLPDWIYDAVVKRNVLTLNRDFFRLRKPLEMRLYELARKHCGGQSRWTVTLTRLREKCGADTEMKKFRQLIRAAAKDNHLPDYRMRFDADVDLVTFSRR